MRSYMYAYGHNNFAHAKYTLKLRTSKVYLVPVVQRAMSAVKWDSISGKRYWMFPDAMQADFEPVDPVPIDFILQYPDTYRTSPEPP